MATLRAARDAIKGNGGGRGGRGGGPAGQPREERRPAEEVHYLLGLRPARALDGRQRLPGARKFAPKSKAKPGRGGRGRQDRSVQITELGDDGEIELQPEGPVTPPLEPESLLSERVVPDLPSVNNTDTGRLVADEGLGVIDTACLFCVAGRLWCDSYKDFLTTTGLSDQILEESESELLQVRERRHLTQQAKGDGADCSLWPGW